MVPQLDKLYYNIGEVAAMFDLNTSNLRYWEKEFKQLSPKKTGKGKRKFSQDDIRLIATINHLVNERGYTLEGARKQLINNKKASIEKVEILEKLSYVKGELQKILRTMKAD